MIIEPYQIDFEEEEAKIDNLPAVWKGERVALLADFQVGMWLSNTDTIEDIAIKLAQEKPLAVFIAGDFIYHPVGDESPQEMKEELQEKEFEEALRELDEAIELLRPLMDADIPIYAVLGNHDYAMEESNDMKLEWLAEQVHTALEKAGINVLINESVAMSSPEGGEGESLYLVGIGSHWADNDVPQRALAQLPVDAPRIALMHNPDSFVKFPPGSAPLALAGHTHGGQIRLPFTPEWSWMAMLAENNVHADGWVDGYGQPGNHLYVNRGIGFSVIPVRINAAPEVTMITLK
ncbi:MAG: metallophosphoesterase [Halomonas sp.]|nr:metallophosphoesterase [Halomonas sp.]